MTHVNLSPTCPKSLQQGQNQDFNVSPVTQNHHALFKLLGQCPENHDPQDHKLVFHHDGSSSTNYQQVDNSASDSIMVDQNSAIDTNLSLSMEPEDRNQKYGDRSGKRMSSKMRLMKPENNYVGTNEDKAIINTSSSGATTQSNIPGIQNERNNQKSPTARVCAECQTTSTPLWRCDLKGPKSLCNACGIRQRKAKRAAIEAGNSLVTSTKTRVPSKETMHNNEKKLSVNKCTQFKKKKNTTATTTDSSSEDVEGFEYFLSKLRKKSGYDLTSAKVCVDCQTTNTPLWRSGPKGFKSLCNACGIRQWKAKRAAGEAGNSLATLSVNKCTQFKKKMNTTATTTATTVGSTSEDMEGLEYFLSKMRKKSGYGLSVCVECQTTSTPLWRSGPKGFKSLCNACGIRQWKAKRAAGEAKRGAGEAGNSLATSTKTIVSNKEKMHNNKKKLSVSKCTQLKKKDKATATTTTATTTTANIVGSSSEDMDRLEYFLSKLRKKSGFEFTSKEVADAALLLMDLSCGYIYS